jgi:hypothetical protein
LDFALPAGNHAIPQMRSAANAARVFAEKQSKLILTTNPLGLMVQRVCLFNDDVVEVSDGEENELQGSQ